jgi:hypothetical protein
MEEAREGIEAFRLLFSVPHIDTRDSAYVCTAPDATMLLQ